MPTGNGTDLSFARNMLLISRNGAVGFPCSVAMPGCKLPWHLLSRGRTGAGILALSRFGRDSSMFAQNLGGLRRFLVPDAALGHPYNYLRPCRAEHGSCTQHVPW